MSALRKSAEIIPIATLVLSLSVFAEPPNVRVTVSSEPLHAGRIDPKLFGNFIELLDDVVPGMWSELLNDRSFEGVIPAANWCYYDGSTDICDRQWDTNATWACVSENPFNGARCAKLAAGSEPASLTQSGLGVARGMTYAFSGYFRADPNLKVEAVLKCLLPTGEWMTLASAELPALSQQWQRYAVKMVSAGTTDRAVFELRAKGNGAVWADKLSLMPGNNVGGWRPDVIEVVKEVRPAIIRWGGSSVDPGRYLWKQGIGDRDLRTPWVNRNWGRLDPNDVGIDEFCRFCELTGCEPLICVSFADGARSAAELVEYCNGGTATVWGGRRASNGHPESYHVKHWQIGNEIGGDDPSYLDQLPSFIELMKKADPAVLIMTSFPSQSLLNRAGKEVAFVCPHHYTPDLLECDRDLNRLSQMLDHTPGCSQIKIGVTEWNIDAGSWGLGRGKQATLGAALMNARYLHVLLRHSDKVEIACRSNLANSYCGAIIETSPSGSGVLKRASYHVMLLYSRHAKPVPLWTEQFTDRIDTFACASEDKTAAVIFAVNPAAEAVELQIGSNRFHGSLRIRKAEAVCDTRNAGQPDIMNHWNVPDRINIIPIEFRPDKVRLPPLSATAIECAPE
jgi:alpha-L-arabinofuranosidase